MLYLSGRVRKFDLISLILIVGAILVSISLIRSYYESQLRYYKSEATFYKEALDRLKKQISVPRYPFATSYERKDYHNYELMDAERLRSGPGEQGAKVILTDYEEIASNRKQFMAHGLFGVTSDKISVNRSLPDVRLSRYQAHRLMLNCRLIEFPFQLQDEEISQATPESLHRHRLSQRAVERFASNDSLDL